MSAAGTALFPLPLDAYAPPVGAGLLETLIARGQAEPFNVIASGLFFAAILHTFLAGKIQHLAHRVEVQHAARTHTNGRRNAPGSQSAEVSFAGQILHFFGEIEAIFGIWAVVLGAAIVGFKGLPTAIDYVAHTANYTEAMFVVVVMAVAGTRPVLVLAERLMRGVARLGRATPAAWWLSILIVAPVLGSFITEPAAMTIAALLLGKQFYALNPSPRLKYATLGLLFVNVSVGGTLTHFAAPPVLMVAAPWQWGLGHMLQNFGWKAVVGIAAATLVYFFRFRGELRTLRPASEQDAARGGEANVAPIPAWVTVAQLGFLAMVVATAHYPVLFIAAFLFFIAFTQATAHHQSGIDLRAPVLVGFFLAGLVVHGGLQGWWIQPVLQSLAEKPLFFAATALTAFNDNAAITYLATLVPNFSDAMKHAVVAGAVTGGGLTVIANAPNPAGQAILKNYFPDGIAPLGLFLGALVPTLVMAICFLVL